MSETSVDTLKKRFDELNETYQEKFAGKNRSELTPEDMEALLGKAKNVLTDVDALGNLEGPAAELRDQLKSLVDVATREKDLIRAARDAGPEFERFAQCGAEANLVFAKYQRHFAGFSRDTRDLGLIQELHEDLKKVRQRMQAIAGKKPVDAMARDLDLVTNAIATYQTEIKEIPNAQSSGTAQEIADRLAALANAQFALYAEHFAGKSRITRRPNLLKRLIDNLRRIRAQMFTLKNGGLESESNANNIKIVDGRVQAYEKELEEIRKVRKDVKLADIMGSLGGAANELFEAYRGEFANKDRTVVSLPRIVVLCDQLDEIYRQMADLGRVEKNESNERNMRIVFDHLSAWNREFDLIRQAQQG